MVHYFDFIVNYFASRLVAIKKMEAYEYVLKGVARLN